MEKKKRERDGGVRGRKRGVGWWLRGGPRTRSLRALSLEDDDNAKREEEK
jgi:hypothetical protein